MFPWHIWPETKVTTVYRSHFRFPLNCFKQYFFTVFIYLIRSGLTASQVIITRDISLSNFHEILRHLLQISKKSLDRFFCMSIFGFIESFWLIPFPSISYMHVEVCLKLFIFNSLLQ